MSPTDQSEPSAVEESARDEASNTTYEGLEQQNEVIAQPRLFPCLFFTLVGCLMSIIYALQYFFFVCH